MGFMLMRIAIVQFRGSNQEHAVVSAIARAGMQSEIFFWDESLDKLNDFAAYVIVDGDRLQFPETMSEIQRLSESGKPVLGLGKGAELLVATGLVPGLENNKVAMALVDDNSSSPSEWVRLSAHYQRNAYTRFLTPNQILRLPAASELAHFSMPPALQVEIELQGLNVLQYCDEEGVVVQGSIAALSNKAGNVMAWLPSLNESCDAIFKSMRDYIEKPHFVVVEPLSYYPRRVVPKAYQPAVGAKIFVRQSKAFDERAQAVENFLKLRGMNLRVQCREYCESELEGAASVSAESLSGMYLVMAKEAKVKSGVIWELNGSCEDVDSVLQMSLLQKAWVEESYVVGGKRR